MLLFLIVLLTISASKNVFKVIGINKDIEAEKARIEKIKAENKALEQQIVLSQSADFIEKEVRDKLGLAKIGEAIVVLPDDETLRKLAPKADFEEDTLPDPTWKRWLKLFI